MNQHVDLNTAIRLHQGAVPLYEPEEEHYSGPVTALVWAVAWTASLGVIVGVGYAALLVFALIAH